MCWDEKNRAGIEQAFSRKYFFKRSKTLCPPLPAAFMRCSPKRKYHHPPKSLLHKEVQQVQAYIDTKGKGGAKGMENPQACGCDVEVQGVH